MNDTPIKDMDLQGTSRITRKTNTAGDMRQFFTTTTPAPKNKRRRITAAFSYIQKIGGAAVIEVVFPQDMRSKLDEKLEKGENLNIHDFPIEWAAVRQLEFLEQGHNQAIKPADVDTPYMALKNASQQRSGGSRIVIMVFGGYEDIEEEQEEDKTGKGSQDSGGGHAPRKKIVDELAILDKELQNKISQTMNIEYLQEDSKNMNQILAESLNKGDWDSHLALPHVGMVLGAKQLFKPEYKSATGRQQKLASQMFDLLNLLSQKHVVHEAGVFLQIPEMTAENSEHLVFSIADEKSFSGFNNFLTTLFPDAKKNHMRSYGDRLTPQSEGFMRDLAQELRRIAQTPPPTPGHKR